MSFSVKSALWSLHLNIKQNLYLHSLFLTKAWRVYPHKFRYLKSCIVLLLPCLCWHLASYLGALPAPVDQ